MLAGVTDNHMVLAATAVALAMQSLSLVFSRFPIAKSTHTDIHGIGVGGVLKELGRCLIVTRGGS